jgi:AcrR family transcriptional regulator
MSTQTDPRFLRSRDAILDAARELLRSEGPSSVTHAQVAERAGIGRATVYRHWPRSDQLLAEAMTTVPMPFFEATATPDRTWLRGELTLLAHQLEHTDVLAVATTLANAALWDTAMDAQREQFAALLDERLATALATVQAQGELVLHGDLETAAARLIGPIYYRSTIERKAVDSHFLDSALDGLGTWRQMPITPDAQRTDAGSLGVG